MGVRQINWLLLMVLLSLIVSWVFIMWWLGVLGHYLIVVGLLTVGTLIGAGAARVGRKLGIRIND